MTYGQLLEMLYNLSPLQLVQEVALCDIDNSDLYVIHNKASVNFGKSEQPVLSIIRLD